MQMNRMQRHLTPVFLMPLLFALGSAAVAGPKPVHNHHDGKQLLGEHSKTEGHHEIHKKGKYSTTVEVRHGKVAGVHVRHSEKGEIAVKKYKTHKKMARAGGHIVYASASRHSVQEYIGTEYIGYAYLDDDGNEEIYWFPYDMIVDGDTGAVEYVPAD